MITFSARAAALLIAASWGSAAQGHSPDSWTSKILVEREDVVRDWTNVPLTGVSASGRFSWFITTRGNLADDATIYTLHIYELKPPAAADAPSGDRIASLTFSSTTNRPPIEAVDFSGDDTSVSFLATRGSKPAQIYRYSLVSRQLTQLSDAAGGIVTYDVEGDAMLFLAAMQPASLPAAPFPRLLASGESIYDFLIPPVAPGTRQGEMREQFQLYSQRVGEQPRPIGTPIEGLNARHVRLSLSPAGTQAIAVLPVPDAAVPRGWQRYGPNPNRAGSTAASLRSARFQRWTQFFLLDLDSGRVRPLVDAPTGEAVLRWGVLHPATKAIWDPQGRHVLLSDTAIPLKLDQDPNAHESGIALMDVSTEEFQPIALLGDGLSDVNYTSDYVDVRWEGMGKPLDVRFRDGSHARVPIPAAKDRPWTLDQLSERKTPGPPDGPKIAFREDANTPPQVFFTGGGKTKSLLSVGADIAQLRTARARPFLWRSGNRNLSGGLLLPTKKCLGKCPLVIQLYAQKWNADHFLPDGVGVVAPYAAQVFAAEGMAVLIFDIGEAQGRTPNAWEEGRAIVNDLDAAVEALALRQNVDRSRVALLGFSRSGYAVRFALTNQGRTHWAAGVAADSFDNSYLQYLSAVGRDVTGVYQATIEGSYGGPPWAAFGFWTERAPGFNLGKIRTPLLLVSHGAEAVFSNWEFYAGLRILKAPVDMIYVPDAEHVLHRPSHRYFVIEYVEKWLKGILFPSVVGHRDTWDSRLRRAISLDNNRPLGNE